jgi:hypothetical protein
MIFSISLCLWFKNDLRDVNANVHYLYGVANVFIKGEIVRSCDEKIGLIWNWHCKVIWIVA